MNITLREARINDAKECGAICYEAFRLVSQQYNFPPNFSSANGSVETLSKIISCLGFWGVVAVVNGQIIGSNFIDQRSKIVSFGPITVHPNMQNKGLGRRLMEYVLQRLSSNGLFAGRLVQSTYHNRSLCLFAKLGFEVREQMSIIQGSLVNVRNSRQNIRSATMDDLDACRNLSAKIFCDERETEIMDAISRCEATVVEHSGHISGYATAGTLGSYCIGETNEDLKALISAKPQISGCGFLLPLRNSELFRWCLEHRLRVICPMTLMTIGCYNEPRGMYIPSFV